MRRYPELAAALAEGVGHRVKWRDKLEAGRERLPEATRRVLGDILERAEQSLGRRKKTRRT